MQLKSLLQNIAILYEKGLFKQCEIKLMKAKKTAYLYERFELVLEVIEYEKKLLNRGDLFKIQENKLDDILEEQALILEKINNTYQYWALYNKMYKLYIQIGKVRSKDDNRKLEKLIKSPLLANDHKTLPCQAQLYFYGFYTDYFGIKGNIEEGYRYCQKAVALIESHPEQIQESTQKYITGLFNTIVSQIALHKFNDALFSIEKLRAITDSSIKSKDLLFFSYGLELEVYTKTGEFDKGVSLIDEIERLIEQHKGRMIMQELMLYKTIAVIYFGLNNFSKSLQWINRAINSPAADVISDQYCMTRILDLIIHFELENEELLEYKVKSVYRFLYKRDRLYQFENTVLNFIRKKLPKINRLVKNEILGAFKELREELITISKDTFEKKVLEYFDFISWLESKIENRPFREIVREAQ